MSKKKDDKVVFSIGGIEIEAMSVESANDLLGLFGYHIEEEKDVE